LKLYNRIIGIKTAWYWHKKRHEDQCDGRPENKPTQSHPLVFNKGSTNICWRKGGFFKTCLKNWIFIFRRLKLDFLTPTLYKSQSKTDERS
jgi:hypothetical protein